MNKILSAILAAAVLFAAAPHAALAQSIISGTWSISQSHASNLVRFDLRSIDGRDQDESSSDLDVTALGLSRAQLDSAGTHVTFTIAREAGSFACEGLLLRGSGTGSFTFTPSQAFLSKMRDRSYADISPRKQMTAAFIDLTMGYIDEIGSAGYRHLPFDKLITYKAIGIDVAYIRSMHPLFHDPSIDEDEMISLRALGVTEPYVTEMRSAGFHVETPQKAITLKAMGIDRNYASQIGNAGYPNLSDDQLVTFRSLGIDSAYIQRVHAHGFPHPTVDQLVQLKSMGVI